MAGPARADGPALFQAHCAVCHQPGGQGVAGLYPRLADRAGRYLKADGGRGYLVHVLLNGMAGAIPEEQIVGFMPPVAHLGDAEIAALLNHVVTGLEQQDRPADFVPFSAEEVAARRAEKLTPPEVNHERRRVLEALKASTAATGGTPAAPGAIPRVTGAAHDYSRNCQGCHLANGRGIPGLVPDLVDFVGYFAHLPEGRAFLVRVPGVAQAPLDDERLAAVLNWMLAAFSRTQLPADFRPFTADEVRRLRADILTAVTAERERLVETLKAAGVVQ